MDINLSSGTSAVPNAYQLVLYSKFVKEGFLGDFARGFLKALESADLSYFKKSYEKIPESESVALVTQRLSAYLDSVIEGRAVDEIKKLAAMWREDKLPGGISRDSITPPDITGTYLQRQQALLQFLPAFTSDINVALQVVSELNLQYAQVYAILTEEYVNISQQRLRESEERLMKISEASFEAIVIHENGVILDTNSNTPKMFGWHPDEVVGKNALETVVAPECYDDVIAKIRAGFEEPYETTAVHVNGTRFPVQILSKTIFFRGRQCRVSAIRDLSVQKMYEAEILAKNNELQRKNDELEQFAYVASHDLKEPLRMISSFTQLLEKKFSKLHDSEANEFMRFTLQGTSRMQLLIDDLLNYSRLGRVQTAPVPVDANKALNNVLFNLKDRIANAGAHVEAEPLPELCISPTHLSQIFQNLIENALKFRSEAAPEIRIKAENINGEMVFSVSDNGIGINHQHKERIFIIFQRLHDRETYQGTGIGLAICKKAVELHNGRIWVESEPGKGSTFYFTLPAAFEAMPVHEQVQGQ